jgi:membrane protease subunit HflK
MSKLSIKAFIDEFRRRIQMRGLSSSIESNRSSFGLPILAEQSNPEGGEGKKPESSGGSEPKNPNISKPGSNDGPPDLDVLWNDFNRRLGNLFGNKIKPGEGANRPSQGSSDSSEPPPRPRIPETSSNSGGGGRNTGGAKKPDFNFQFPKVGFGLIVAIVVGLWAMSGFFIVQEGQAGIVLQFGKYKYTARPGINWRLPYPFQSHETVNLSGVRSVEIGRPTMIQSTNLKDSSMLTEDENIIDVRFAVQYRLKDPVDYLFTNRDPDLAVVQAAQTAVREIVGRSKMDTVLYEGREKIAIDLSASIQKILDSYRSGITITSVTVQNVQPPEQVQAAFDDAVKAGQDQERLKNEGEAYANEIIPKAKGTAARLIQEAEGYKAKVVAMAEGDASRFKQVYVEYAKAPQVTRDRMYIDTMQQIFSNVSKVMVDVKTGNQLLYLPLEKLVSQVSEGAAPGSSTANSSNQAPAAQSPSSTTTQVTPAPNADKRENLRSRERDAR